MCDVCVDQVEAQLREQAGLSASLAAAEVRYKRQVEGLQSQLASTTAQLVAATAAAEAAEARAAAAAGSGAQGFAGAVGSYVAPELHVAGAPGLGMGVGRGVVQQEGQYRRESYEDGAAPVVTRRTSWQEAVGLEIGELPHGLVRARGGSGAGGAPGQTGPRQGSGGGVPGMAGGDLWRGSAGDGAPVAAAAQAQAQVQTQRQDELQGQVQVLVEELASLKGKHEHLRLKYTKQGLRQHALQQVLLALQAKGVLEHLPSAASSQPASPAHEQPPATARQHAAPARAHARSVHPTSAPAATAVRPRPPQPPASVHFGSTLRGEIQHAVGQQQPAFPPRSTTSQSAGGPPSAPGREQLPSEPSFGFELGHARGRAGSAGSSGRSPSVAQAPTAVRGTSGMGGAVAAGWHGAPVAHVQRPYVVSVGRSGRSSYTELELDDPPQKLNGLLRDLNGSLMELNGSFKSESLGSGYASSGLAADDEGSEPHPGYHASKPISSSFPIPHVAGATSVSTSVSMADMGAGSGPMLGMLRPERASDVPSDSDTTLSMPSSQVYYPLPATRPQVATGAPSVAATARGLSHAPEAGAADGAAGSRASCEGGGTGGVFAAQPRPAQSRVSGAKSGSGAVGGDGPPAPVEVLQMAAQYAGVRACVWCPVYHAAGCTLCAVAAAVLRLDLHRMP